MTNAEFYPKTPDAIKAWEWDDYCKKTTAHSSEAPLVFSEWVLLEHEEPKPVAKKRRPFTVEELKHRIGSTVIFRTSQETVYGILEGFTDRMDGTINKCFVGGNYVFDQDCLISEGAMLGNEPWGVEE